MNLKGQQAAKYCAAPDPKKAGLLIFGADAMRVALKRQEAILALVGPQGEAEMRLTRLPAAELRKDGAALSDASFDNSIDGVVPGTYNEWRVLGAKPIGVFVLDPANILVRQKFVVPGP